MKTLRLLPFALCAFAVAACSQADEEVAAADAPPPPPDWTVPERFLGEWQGDLTDCGQAAELRLVIGEDTLDFTEATGKVLATDEYAEGITIVGEFTGPDPETGETIQWRRTYYFDISADEQTLTYETMDYDPVVRHRCP